MKKEKSHHLLMQKKKMTKTITAVFTLLIILSSCSETKKAAGDVATETNNGNGALYQNEWKLTEVQGEMIVAGSKAMMLFTAGQPGKITGHTGCNRMTGSFVLSGTNTIKFSPMAVTRMACLDDNANSIERKFTTALTEAGTWLIENETLLLKNGENIVARLKAQKPATAEELQLNGTWELNYISGAKIAFEGLFPDKKPTIVFDFPGGQASGNGGCNGYSVPVKVTGYRISFGDALSTMMACEGSGEPVYFKTLKGITSFSVQENTLTLIMDDIAVMRFAKK